MILESGEEIYCGFSTNIFKYLQSVFGANFVPLHGNRDYAVIKNIYSEEHNQLVSFKSEWHD